MQRTLTNRNFDMFAATVAAPYSPEDYNAAAMERLMKYLHPYMVDVKGIRFKHHARNFIQLINFTSPEERKAYNDAYENYLKAVAMLEAREGGGGAFMILVQFLKFRQAAELIRAPVLAKRAYETAMRENKSMVIACNFKETISKIVTILVRDYGVSRDDISLIWGGNTSKRKKNNKNKMKEMTVAQREQLLAAFSTPEDREMLKDMGIIDLDEAEQVEEVVPAAPKYAADLRLGAQSIAQRQIEIDRFQSDQSRFCLFSFKAGGVGLSLHQHHPNLRVRETLLAPTYSAIELVQGLGRTARLTSCSDTKQTILFYAGTIEVHVAMRVSAKLKCLTKVVRQRESWEDVIYGSHPVTEVEARVEEAETEDLNGVDTEEEEDNEQ